MEVWESEKCSSHSFFMFFQTSTSFPQLSRNRESEHLFFFLLENTMTKILLQNTMTKIILDNTINKKVKKTCLLCKSSLLLPSLHQQLVLTSI